MKATSTGGLYSFLLLILLVLLAFSLFSSIEGKHGKRKMVIASEKQHQQQLSERSAALSEKARAKILGGGGNQPPPQLDEKSLAEMKAQVEELLSSVEQTISKCTSKGGTASLAELAGEWTLAYYREPGKRQAVAIHLEYSQLQGGSVHLLTGSLKEAGNPKDYVIQLVQLAEVAQPAILFSLLPVGEHIIKLPVLLVDATQPERYFTVFQTGLLLPEYIDWAVYTRPGVRLSGGQLKKATAGLRCLTSDAEEEEDEEEGGGGGGRLVYPVGK